MKTAIYIEDGVTQIVLTPESDYEKKLIQSFGGKLKQVKIFEGSFYDCRGGWVRQGGFSPSLQHHAWHGNDNSLILRVDEGDETEGP